MNEEVPLNWNKWVRQTHRWLSIAFTVGVIVNFVAVIRGKYAVWTGLFMLPYASKWGSARRTG